jgi:drug/metabolite transporter (DMT)-like permease
MAVLWGSNFTVVKVATRSIPELPFNGLRLLVATAAFLAAIRISEGWPRLTRQEWVRVAQLAVLGHVLYQVCFVAAVKRTSVANSSLIFAFTPVVVALLTAAVGHERVPLSRWAGALLSMSGIYLVVGARAGSADATLVGDLLATGAMCCWAIYTVAARPLLTRRSAVTVTGYSMAIGSVLYLPLAWSGLRDLAWRTVPLSAWVALILSALLALFVAYVIWYTAVQTIGGTRTSMYSNITPLVAITVAAIWLGEPITLRKVIGAAAVIAGLAITRLERQPLPPAET